jgi:AAA domain
MPATAQQQQAIEFLDSFRTSFELIGCLQGYAGVGKTWVVSHWMQTLLEANPDISICVAAPTHKALDVLRGKCGHLAVEFKTVASLLGQHISRNEDGEITKGESPRDWSFDIVLIDEASMVNLEQCEKLAAKGWKILYVGDPAQLPPVGEDTSPAFNYPTKFLMTEVVRQQADNPVIGIATMLRDRIAEGASFTLNDIGAFAVAGDNRLRKVSRAKLHDWALGALDKGLNGRILAYAGVGVEESVLAGARWAVQHERGFHLGAGVHQDATPTHQYACTHELGDARCKKVLTSPIERPVRPYFEHGFWWWFDPKRNGWFAGTAPQIQKPGWAA